MYHYHYFISYVLNYYMLKLSTVYHADSES